MSGMQGISAYQQISRTIQGINLGSDREGVPVSSKTDQTNSKYMDPACNVETKGWTPVGTGSSLIPHQTEYGNTIGDVQLSEKAKDYYNKLRSKFHNMDFIAVSKDMKAQVQQNAASYGNANKMVVLIDEEKIERMATDESFRKKYEGIIAMSQSRLSEAKNSLASSGANVKNFGMSVDGNGKESFFAVTEKSNDLQKKRIEKKTAEKKEQKIKEKKQSERKALEERIQRIRDKKASTADPEESREKDETNDREYVTIEADSIDHLLSKVQSFSYDLLASKVMTDAERMMGTKVDYRG